MPTNSSSSSSSINNTYFFEIQLVGRKTYTSGRYPESNYAGFIKACEKKIQEFKRTKQFLDVKICYTTEFGNTFVREPEHGELLGW